MKDIYFELPGLKDIKHVKGSLSCKAGACNNEKGLYTNIIPLLCECGGIIHGTWQPSSINNTFGPNDIFICDKCEKEYIFDEVMKIRKEKKQEALNVIYEWINNHPTPDEIIFYSSLIAMSAKDLVNNMKNETKLGKHYLNSLIHLIAKFGLQRIGKMTKKIDGQEQIDE